MNRILIIEDDQFVRANIIELLHEEGYETYEAENGRKGIDIAKEIIPDLIISDVLMPYMDGHQVADELKRNPGTESIPFIYLTAKAESADIQNGFKKGANFYIIKPYKAKDLLKAIQLSLSKT